MKVYTKIPVPDGKYCETENPDGGLILCDHLTAEKPEFCQVFSGESYRHPKVKGLNVYKLPECLALPEALPCGHHPDALMDEYGDGEKWCAACAVKERQP